jgi:NitT/TauT family transport system substrate-binding protein
MRGMLSALVAIASCGAVFAPDAGRAQGIERGVEPAVETLKVGVNKVISDIVFYIAEERGFFAEQKLKVELIAFDSGPRMIAPLGAGQIDIGAGASSAGLYNAFSRGIIVKIVADKGSTPPGYDYMPLIVRKDLVDSGKVKTLADLKGLKLAAAGPGSATNAKLDLALIKGGLHRQDVVEVNLNYPQQVTALASKAIDGSITTEPSASNAIASGVAVRFSDDSLYPGQQVAALLYGDALLTKRRDVGQRFMIAYVKAARIYNDATRGGHFDGPGADQVIDLIMKTTGLTDRAMFKSMVPNGISPNGEVNIASLAGDLSFFQAQGQIEKPVSAVDVVDMSFAENAVKALGPYIPAH